MQEAIKRLRKFEMAATPGPWSKGPIEEGSGIHFLLNNNGEKIGDLTFSRDGRLIAEMRNALPQLLNKLEKLETAAVQAALDCRDAGCELIAEELEDALAALED